MGCTESRTWAGARAVTLFAPAGRDPAASKRAGRRPFSPENNTTESLYCYFCGAVKRHKKGAASDLRSRLHARSRAGARDGGTLRGVRRPANYAAGDRQVDDLGDLAAGGLVVLPEVGAVLVVAGLARAAAGVARDHSVAVRRLHEIIERRAREHVLEAADRRVAQRPARGDHVDLAQLAARDVVVGAEVGAVGAVARLVRPAAVVARDDGVGGRGFDHGEEGIARRHIGEGVVA